MGVQTMASRGVGSGGGGSLSRQGSVYSLTLTEVETQLGEPLRSMNLEDLLRTVLPAAGDAATAGKKTVDEVWRDIQNASAGGRHPTMGEMTLEDFLSRAGVISGPHWLHQYQPQPPPPPQQQFAVVAAAPPSSLYCDAGSGGGFLSSQVQVSGRKRSAPDADGVVEKTVERRQKRMIKNRESAARSRARKQAYTNELEIKIAKLQEENDRLRKLKMLEPLELPPEHERRTVPVLVPVVVPETKKQLRRTNSARF